MVIKLLQTSAFGSGVSSSEPAPSTALSSCLLDCLICNFLLFSGQHSSSQPHTGIQEDCRPWWYILLFMMFIAFCNWNFTIWFSCGIHLVDAVLWPLCLEVSIWHSSTSLEVSIWHSSTSPIELQHESSFCAKGATFFAPVNCSQAVLASVTVQKFNSDLHAACWYFCLKLTRPFLKNCCLLQNLCLYCCLFQVYLWSFECAITTDCWKMTAEISGSH